MTTHLQILRLVACVSIAATINIVAPIVLATQTLDVVAVSGRIAPGISPPVQFGQGSPVIFPGVYESPFSALSIADDGRVAFGAKLDRQLPQADDGLWTWKPRGPFARVAREGDQTPDFSGIYNNSHSQPFRFVRATTVGTIFSATTNGAFSSGIFQNDGITTIIAREGQPVPDASDLHLTSVGGVASQNGNVVMRASYGDGVTFVARNGLWLDAGSGFHPVALERQLAPGVGKPFFSFPHVAVSDSGQVAFVASYFDNDHTTSAVESGVWAFSESGLRLVADLSIFASVDKPVFVNNRGDVVFQNNRGEAFFAAAPQLNPPIRVLGPTTDQIGGLSDTGLVAFGSSTQIASVDQFGTVQLIANEGQVAPGLSSDYTLGGFLQPPVINQSGTIAFLSYVEKSGALVGIGVFAKKPDEPLLPIILPGQSIDIASGGAPELRTVVGIDNFGSTDGPSIALNSRGELAALVAFSDGSSAVVLSRLFVVPEPAQATLAILAVCCLILTFRCHLR